MKQKTEFSFRRYKPTMPFLNFLKNGMKVGYYGMNEEKINLKI
jgi:hypothetical protein